MSRFQQSATLLVLALASSLATAQLSILQEVDVPFIVGGQQVGFAVAGPGDLNGDGFADFVEGDPGYLLGRGRITARSGQDGAILWTFVGNLGDQVGRALAGAGDIDGDGVNDVVMGAPLADPNGASSGSATVLSGVDGSVLFTVNGLTAGEQLGFSVGGGGDVNGDGVPDIVAGSPLYDGLGIDSGRIRVYSGATQAFLYGINGVSAGDQLGYAVDIVGDMNGDGKAEVAVGAPFDDTTNGVDSGRIQVFAIIHPAGGGLPLISVLFAKDGSAAGDRFGFSLDDAGDVNGDGLADLIAGAPGVNNPSTDSGSLQVLAGPDGALLYFRAATGFMDQLGTTVAGVGDVNGDGCDDFAAGAIETSNETGFVRVYSGLDGTVLDTYDGIVDEALGTALSRAGDVNGDGIDDLIAAYTGGENHLVVLGFTASRSGSGEDLVLRTAIGFGPASQHPDVKSAFAGDLMTVRMLTPRGTFLGRTPFIVGQLFTTGIPPVSPMGFPEVHVDPASAFVLFNGTSPFGPVLLTDQGLTLYYGIPLGLGGSSVMLQGIVSSVTATNGIFAATLGQEIRFVL